MSTSIEKPSVGGEAPALSINIEIDFPTYSLTQSTELPTLRIDVTSHANQPLTVFTFPYILNPQLALRRNNFYCKDLSESGEEVWLNLSRGPMRPAFCRQLGHSDEQYFLELQPEHTTTITCPFTLAAGWKHRDPRRGEGSVHAGVTYKNYLEPGHRYEFGLKLNNEFSWWRYGTKVENLEPVDALPAQVALGSVNQNPILLDSATTIIEILE